MLAGELTILVALAAGLVSFLSPCILPLIPGFLAYLAGSSPEDESKRRVIFLNSLAFVLGFSLVFALLGVALNTVLERVAYDVQLWLGRIGGAVIILFGLYLLGIVRIPFLEREHKLQVQRSFGSRYLTSFAFGAAFAAGWTPCVGAVLGSILGLAVAAPGSAFVLLLAYSLGLGIPFLLVGAFTSRASDFIHRWGRAFHYAKIVFGIVLIGLGILAFSLSLGRIANLEFLQRILNPVPAGEEQNSGSDGEALRAGRELAGDKCSGEGPGTLTRLPMDPEDFAIILPYGLVIGGHVTPIDHQYYSPTVFTSPRDTYPVYAMADARLVDVQPRDTEQGREYRMVFSMTCTFLYYYDLVTSLSPEIQTAYEQGDIDLPVTSGQLIGRIGGQTLDFAVWDAARPLSGFVNPESYRSEGWKIYTADPLDYATPEVREGMLAKYVRTAEPRSGKIDHDRDGRLVGNWFEEGTNGYAGAGGEYWAGHLSIAPDYIDPTATIVSLGRYRGEPAQFSIPRSAPDPAEVSAETGPVGYDLVSWQYEMGETGRYWDRTGYPAALPLTLANAGFSSQGCILLELIEDRRLRSEAFPGKTCSSVSGFTPAARIYVR